MQRRQFLRVALATAALAPMGGALASCAAGGGEPTSASSGPAGTVSDKNPFGVPDNSVIDAVIFKGGYGIDYVNFAAAELTKNLPTVKANVAPSTNIAQELQPRFVAGNPPDLIDNSGAKEIGISTIIDQLEDLNSVIEAKNLEGTVIKDTLYQGVTAPGTFDGKFVALNYALTVYALWYSASLFEENGWTPPKTWDEALDLGAKAKAKGKYLFLWGKEAATYYQTLAIASAIKEGGDEVRLALENLKPDCWSMPAVQSVFTGMKKIIDAGYFKPGGSGTKFTAAQAQWSNDEDATALPVGVVDRERDEGSDQGRLQDDRRRRADRHRRQQDAVRGPAQHGRRAVHRPVEGQERGRRQGAAAGHAVEGGRDQLRQDPAGSDHRQGHDPRRRVRLDRPGVPDQAAGGRRVEHLLLDLRSSTTA